MVADPTQRNGQQRRPAYKSGVVALMVGIPAILFFVVFYVVSAYMQSNRDNSAIVSITKFHISDHSENILSSTGDDFVLINGTASISIPASLMVTWREDYIRPWTGKHETRVNPDDIRDYLEELAPRINTQPKNARLAAEDGIIYEIQPAEYGISLDIEKTINILMNAFSQGRHSANVAIVHVESKLSLKNLERLGINKLIGVGSSNFGGSPASRVHNIGIGAKTLDQIFISPGEEFSFNTAIGDIDAKAGYLPGLVIKGTKLVPEYGGGICQVATTFFRAIMESGMPVTERRPHALPVQYYNPQGYDATIYQGVTDLKFKNDTMSPILVQSRIEGTKLYFEFYGNDDGRTVTIDGPYQYDVNPDGSMKAVISRTVTYADGTVDKKSWYSSYKSPALFQTIRNPLE